MYQKNRVHKIISKIRKRNLAATIELMSIRDIAYLPELIHYLGDDNEFVRSYITLSLISFPENVIVMLLAQEAYSENECRKKHAIEIINRFT